MYEPYIKGDYAFVVTSKGACRPIVKVSQQKPFKPLPIQADQRPNIEYWIYADTNSRWYQGELVDWSSIVSVDRGRST